MGEKIFTLREDIFYDKNPEGIFILNPSGETLILDDQVAVVIWEELNDKTAVETNSLVNLLLEKFQLEVPSRGEIQSDISRFLVELKNYGLVEERNNET